MNNSVPYRAICKIAGSIKNDDVRSKILEAAPGFMNKLMPWTKGKTPQYKQHEQEPAWISQQYDQPAGDEKEDLGISNEMLQEPADLYQPESDISDVDDFTDLTTKNLGNYLKQFLYDLKLDEMFVEDFTNRVTDEIAMQLNSQKLPMPGQTVFQSSWNRIDKIASDLSNIADMLDRHGMTKKATQIDNLLSEIGLLKIAQYEGGQHYHIMNGRAIEKAWREKRKKKPSDDARYHLDEKGYYRSANECWWEVLEEYQDKLFGNHKEWLSKHAATTVAKDKKKKSNKETEEASGTVSPGATMSGPMNEEAKKRRDGKGVQEYLEQGGMQLPSYQKASILRLMSKIAERVDNGSSIGVAFYEAMDYLTNEGSPKDMIVSAHEVLYDVEKYAKSCNDKKLEKIAYQGVGKALNWLKDVSKGVGNTWNKVKQMPSKAMDLPGKVKDWGQGQMDSATMYQKMKPSMQSMQFAIDKMSQYPEQASTWLEGIGRHLQTLNQISEDFNLQQQGQEEHPAQTQMQGQDMPGATLEGKDNVPTLPLGDPSNQEQPSTPGVTFEGKDKVPTLPFDGQSSTPQGNSPVVPTNPAGPSKRPVPMPTKKNPMQRKFRGLPGR